MVRVVIRGQMPQGLVGYSKEAMEGLRDQSKVQSELRALLSHSLLSHKTWL